MEAIRLPHGDGSSGCSRAPDQHRTGNLYRLASNSDWNGTRFKGYLRELTECNIALMMPNLLRAGELKVAIALEFELALGHLRDVQFAAGTVHGT